jgi:hypothetical protein
VPIKNRRESGDEIVEEGDHVGEPLLALALELQGEGLVGLLEQLQTKLLVLQSEPRLELRVSLEYLLGPEVEHLAQNVQLGAADRQVAQADLGLDFALFGRGEFVVDEVQPGVGEGEGPLQGLLLVHAGLDAYFGELADLLEVDVADC